MHESQIYGRLFDRIRANNIVVEHETNDVDESLTGDLGEMDLGGGGSGLTMEDLGPKTPSPRPTRATLAKIGSEAAAQLLDLSGRGSI